MIRLNLTTIVFALLTIAACKKSITTDKSAPPLSDNKTNNAVEECQPHIFNLAVVPGSGESYIFKVTGSPGASPVTLTNYVVSGTNQLTECNGNPILNASGLAFDPATGIFYGTTGSTGSVPNAIFKFTDPNCVSLQPAKTTCPIALDLSDVERDPTTGEYYAINRGAAPPTNRIVKLGLPLAPTVDCLPNPLPRGLNARGLTFTCNGQLIVMHTAGTAGTVVYIDKVTGSTGPTFAYPGPITTTPAVATPEVGLHFDCGCIGRFITGSYNPFTATRMTDGLPSGMGGPIYNTAIDVLKPSVDFTRP